jgi:hypothetical protein
MSQGRIQDADIKTSAEAGGDSRVPHDTKVYVTSESKLLSDALADGTVAKGTIPFVLTTQSSTPAAPAAGKVKVYAKTDGRVYVLNSSGVETELGLEEGFTPENIANKTTDGTFAANSDTLYPSEKAAKTYSDTKVPLNYLDTDTALTANSDSKLATQKAAKTYVDVRSTPTEYNAGNSNTALAINWNNGAVQHVSMTGNCTFSFSNPVVGSVYVMRLVQDAIGARTYAWPGNVKWPAGVGPTGSAANKIDLVNFYYDGTYYYGCYTTNY